MIIISISSICEGNPFGIQHVQRPFVPQWDKYIVYTSDLHTALQSQKAVTAYFSSEQLLPFGITRQQSGRSLRSVSCHSALRGLQLDRCMAEPQKNTNG